MNAVITPIYFIVRWVPPLVLFAARNAGDLQVYAGTTDKMLFLMFP